MSSARCHAHWNFSVSGNLHFSYPVGLPVCLKMGIRGILIQRRGICPAGIKKIQLNLENTLLLIGGGCYEPLRSVFAGSRTVWMGMLP